MITRRHLLTYPAAAGPLAALGAAPIVLTYPQHGATRDTLNGYAPALLAMALGRSGRSYQLRECPDLMAQSRVMIEVGRPRPLIDVFWTMTSIERERMLRPIRIPIERGLIGWRVALVRLADKERWRSLRGLQDLKSHSAGQMHDWPDTEILRANGLSVLTSPQYESLVQMLSRGRFDYFPRSVLEIESELQDHAGLDLAIEPHFALRYPSALYFFVDPKRTELAADLQQGLEACQADGSFERLFRQHFAATIANLRLKQRRVLVLHNPVLPPSVPLQRRDWWLNPGV
jgi:hypothetical protein